MLLSKGNLTETHSYRVKEKDVHIVFLYIVIKAYTKEQLTSCYNITITTRALVLLSPPFFLFYVVVSKLGVFLGVNMRNTLVVRYFFNLNKSSTHLPYFYGILYLWQLSLACLNSSLMLDDVTTNMFLHKIH